MIVYAGAIMVLFVFAIMVLTPGKEETGPDPRRGARWIAVPIVGVFLILSALALRSATMQTVATAPRARRHRRGRTPPVHDYLFPFELTSLLLLAAIVGVAPRSPTGGREDTMVLESYYVGAVGGAVRLGVVGVLIRRNPLVIFMSIEMMFNAANLALVAFGQRHNTVDGQALVFFVMCVAAAEVAVGLAIIVVIFRLRRRLSVDDLSMMRW